MIFHIKVEPYDFLYKNRNSPLFLVPISGPSTHVREGRVSHPNQWSFTKNWKCPFPLKTKVFTWQVIKGNRKLLSRGIVCPVHSPFTNQLLPFVFLFTSRPISSLPRSKGDAEASPDQQHTEGGQCPPRGSGHTSPMRLCFPSHPLACTPLPSSLLLPLVGCPAWQLEHFAAKGQCSFKPSHEGVEGSKSISGVSYSVKEYLALCGPGAIACTWVTAGLGAALHLICLLEGQGNALLCDGTCLSVQFM